MFFSADNDDFWEWRDGGDDSGGEFDSSVDFVDFEDVVSGIVSAINEGLHVMVDFLSAEVHVSSQKSEDVGGLSIWTHLPQNILIFII